MLGEKRGQSGWEDCPKKEFVTLDSNLSETLISSCACSPKTKRESAYFVVTLHELKRVVVAVRGTETPDDLLTDGLSVQTPLSEADLLGLLR